MPNRKSSLSLLALLAAAVWAHAAGAAEAGHKAGEVVIESGMLTTAEGRMVPFEIGTLFVPENRAVIGSRIIGIGFARLRSSGAGTTPPMFALPGGPGDSFLGAVTDTGERPQRQLMQFLQYSAAGDVVIVDQRGNSRRGENLRYGPRPQPLPLDRPASLEHDTAAFAEVARSTVASNSDKDLSGYTVIQCAEDVNDLRRALGYEQITLLGQSFGSQWSLAVMRLHPESVARALLSGVEPLNNHYDMPSHVFAALQRLAFDADQDTGLQPWLPKGGLMQAVQEILQRLTRVPARVVVKDAQTGASETVVLGPGDFQQALLEPKPADWPAFILALYHGRYDDWAREVLQQRRRSEPPEALIGPLIDTSIGVTAERGHLLRTDPAVALLGAWNFDAYLASKPAWPTADIGDALRTPVLDLTPVVFVHGDWDLSTPVENTLGLLPYFPNGRALLVHRGGHGARSDLLVQQPETRAKIIEFLRTGDTRGLPVTAALPVPAFRLPSFPAPPGTRP